MTGPACQTRGDVGHPIKLLSLLFGVAPPTINTESEFASIQFSERRKQHLGRSKRNLGQEGTHTVAFAFKFISIGCILTFYWD